jgi:hypothetical protein
MEEASVVRLLSTQVPEAGAVIGRAFWNDPLTLYVLPDETHRREAIGPWFESVVRYGDLFAEVYTTLLRSTQPHRFSKAQRSGFPQTVAK